MNTITETKSRLRLLVAALQGISDNYGITSAQATNFSVQMQELQDIVDNVDIAPPAQPVTVADVTADISEQIAALVGHVNTSNNIAIEALSGKIDQLIALANAAGEPAAA